MTAASKRIAAAWLAAMAMAPEQLRAQADPPPLVTDRPSFTSAARVVGRGTVQLESGAAVTGEHVDRVVGSSEFTTLELPNALLRVGLSRRLELRVAMIGWIRTTAGAAGGDSSSALSNVDLAGEYQFAAQERLGVDLALIAGVSVPTEQFGVGDHTVDPFAQLVWGRDLTDTIDVGGMFAFSLPSSAGHRLETWSGSAFFGHPLGGPWSAFWEAVAGNQDVADGRMAWTGNVGVLLAIGDDVQLDAFAGRGLNAAAADWAAGAGISVRWR